VLIGLLRAGAGVFAFWEGGIKLGFENAPHGHFQILVGMVVRGRSRQSTCHPALHM